MSLSLIKIEINLRLTEWKDIIGFAVNYVDFATFRRSFGNISDAYIYLSIYTLISVIIYELFKNVDPHARQSA